MTEERLKFLKERASGEHTVPSRTLREALEEIERLQLRYRSAIQTIIARCRIELEMMHPGPASPPTKKKVLVLAATFYQFLLYCQQRHLRIGGEGATYVYHVEEILGYQPEDVEIHLAPGYEAGPAWAYIRDNGFLPPQDGER